MRVGRLGFAAFLFGMMGTGHALEVGVEFSTPAYCVINVTNIPKNEPLGGLRLRLHFKPEAGIQIVAGTPPELGPWSQVAPEIRRSGDDLTIWALAPNLGASQDADARTVIHLELSLAAKSALTTAADLIDSVVVEEALTPLGQKTLVSPKLVTGLAARPRPFTEMPVEKMHGLGRSLNFKLGKTVRVRIYVSDFRGRSVANILDEKLAAGLHEITWDGKADGGKAMAAGTYSLRFEAGTYVYDRKLEVAP